MEKACGHNVPYKIAPRRPGDLATCYANPEKARNVLKWKAMRDMDKMCEDSWRWQSTNPQGFGGSTPSAKDWELVVLYAMAKEITMWNALCELYLSKASSAVLNRAKAKFQLVAQSCKDQYARGPCVAALDEAGDAVDKLSSKVKVPHSDTLHSKFETWKAQRLSLAKSQL